MSDEPNGGAGPSGSGTEESHLHDRVSTGMDNLLQVGPFRVHDVDCPEWWDPSSANLPLAYQVHDPNRRVLSGRIIYLVPAAEGARTIVHAQSLSPSQFTHGQHQLEAAQQWDGTISEGLTDQAGQKITEDLSPVFARVELWNSAGAYARGSGQHLSVDSDTTRIDPIAEARWDNYRCIPYEDPEEPELGTTKMIIRVKNIREETRVRILVARIMRIDLPGCPPDESYVATGEDTANQPGLEGAVVRNERVVLADDSEPSVRWNRYDDHWPTEDQNNFYCFYLGFGDRGDWVPASERDHENHERDCLHMRFTVFVHAPSTDLSYHVNAARSLHRFFRRETKYFRSYLKIRQFTSLQDWGNHIRRRYIVIVLGHSSCSCDHADHPKKADGSFKGVFRRGFEPDQNVCPDDLAETAQYGGCGHKSEVRHYFWMGRFPAGTQPPAHAGKELLLGCDSTRETNDRLHLRVVGVGSSRIGMTSWRPRFLYYTGGCRSILTTNFGEYFVHSGTKFFAGWTYVGLDLAEYRLTRRLFRRWIKGTGADPAPAEYLTRRFVQAYAAVSQAQSIRRYHPRLIDSTCTPVPPDSLEDQIL